MFGFGKKHCEEEGSFDIDAALINLRQSVDKNGALQQKDLETFHLVISEMQKRARNGRGTGKEEGK
jgi:hypothetical protein